MAYKQKTWWKSELAYLKGWLKYRKGLLISLGVIILLIGAFLYIMGRPYYIVNRNPITVNARITYIYHVVGKYSQSRHYQYMFYYNDSIYYGETESGAHLVFGGIGDTLIIRCNKNNPHHSVFQYPDNPNLKIRKLEGAEYYRFLRNEPNKYDKR